MRKIPALLTVLGLTALSLAGCATVGAPGCSRPPEADAGLRSQVTIAGAVGSEPEVQIDTPMHVDSAATWEVAQGEGTPVTSDDQLVAVDVALFDATTGAKLVSTAFDADQSRVFGMSQWIQTFPPFGKLLHCAAPGARVVMALPPDGVAPEAASTLGVGEGDSTVVVVDVSKTYLTRATGTTVFNDAHDMPTVVRAPNGQPGILVPEANAPTSILVQTLIRGDGAVLKDSDTARVNYTGVPWEQKGSVFDTTWGANAASVPVGKAPLPGFTEALKGQTIGSQVLVVVPADKVPADTAATVPAGKALVYVIDVLGVDAAATASQ